MEPLGDIIPLGELPKGRVSTSAEDTYALCGEKYRRQYIGMEKQAPAVPLVKGSAIHGGLAWAASEQIRGKRRPAKKDILEYADQLTGLELSRAEADGQKMEWKAGETLDTLRVDVMRGLDAYESKVGKTLRPVESEQVFFHRPKGKPYEISGKLDIYDEQGFIRDYKTSGRRMDDNAALHNHALTTYQMHVESTGRVVNGLALDGIIIKKGSVEIQQLEVAPRTEAQKAERLQRSDMVVRGIRAGVFVKTDNWQACKWCGFLKDCQPVWYAAKKAADSDGQ